MTLFSVSSEGPSRRCIEPQLQTVPAGLGVAGTLLQRAPVVSHTLLGLPATLFPAALPAPSVPPESGPVLARE